RRAALHRRRGPGALYAERPAGALPHPARHRALAGAPARLPRLPGGRGPSADLRRWSTRLRPRRGDLNRVPTHHRQERAMFFRPDAEPAQPVVYWALEPAELARRLGSGREGLSSAEAAARLHTFGRNELHKQRGLSRLRVLWNQLRSPLLLLLLFAAAVSAGT